MSKVYVYSGLPGSGKSSIIKKQHPNATVFSADDFFMVHGEYKFDPTKIGNAHADCFRLFIDALLPYSYRMQNAKAGECNGPEYCLVVDNTNTTAVEIAPYMLAADAYGIEAEVVTVKCDPRVALDRNVHGVPWEAQCDLLANLNKRELMPWWKSSTIVNDREIEND